MSRRDDTLPDDLVWQSDGHLSEVALGVLADGQDAIVPREAGRHLDGCEPCATRLGAAALRAYAVSEALAQAGIAVPLSRPAVARGPMPWAAVVAALALASVCTLPRLSAVVAGVTSTLSTLSAVLPQTLQAGVHGGAFGTLSAVGALSVVSTFVLLAGGWLLARAASTPIVEGGRA